MIKHAISIGIGIGVGAVLSPQLSPADLQALGMPLPVVTGIFGAFIPSAMYAIGGLVRALAPCTPSRPCTTGYTGEQEYYTIQETAKQEEEKGQYYNGQPVGIKQQTSPLAKTKNDLRYARDEEIKAAVARKRELEAQAKQIQLAEAEARYQRRSQSQSQSHQTTTTETRPMVESKQEQRNYRTHNQQDLDAIRAKSYQETQKRRQEEQERNKQLAIAQEKQERERRIELSRMAKERDKNMTRPKPQYQPTAEELRQAREAEQMIKVTREHGPWIKHLNKVTTKEFTQDNW